MSVFLAIIPPREALEHLQDHLSQTQSIAASQGLDPVRWTAPATWHVTVVFAGEPAVEQADAWSSALAHDFARRSPVPDLRLTGTGSFDDTVLWCGLLSPNMAILGELMHAARRSARQVGIDIERRRWHPHLTLARAASRTSVRPWARLLGDYRGPAWSLEHLSLLSSLGGPAPHYTMLREWTLGELALGEDGLHGSMHQ